jgi:signal transduction histidine kinase
MLFLERRLEVLWGAFVLANAVAIVVIPAWETVPFHLIWISLALVCGHRLWRTATILWAILACAVVSGAALAWAVARNDAGLDETAEVPLMSAILLAVVWSARRRQASIGRVLSRYRQRERDLVRRASDQLRTPITVAQGHAELIATEHAGEQAAEDARVILDELSHLSRISDRLLLLTVAEDPGFLQRRPVELERLIVDTARRWTTVADRRWSVRVVADGILEVDEERLGEALDALIENAVTYTASDDGITVAAWADHSDAVIEISDTGEGIPARDLPQIFDRFARVSRGKSGTGLGLAIVKAIVDAHGGTVTVESELGGGTVFRIRLGGLEAVPLARPVPAPLG